MVANVLGDVVAKLTLIHLALNFKIQLLLKTILNRYAFSYFFISYGSQTVLYDISF